MSEDQLHNTKSKYIDKNVIYFLLVMFAFSFIGLLYKYHTSFPCDQISISIDAKEFRVGELVTFVDYTENTEEWKWTFGDDSKGATKRQALHVYNKAGEYTIQLTVNSGCEIERTLTILEPKVILDVNKIPKIHLPDAIKVGEKLEVQDSTLNAYSWEWRFGETADVNSFKKNASYTYETSGLKTVSLIINGDVVHIAKKQISIIPIEEEEEPITVITSGPRVTEADLGWDIPYEPEVNKNKPKEEAKAAPVKKKVPYISEPAFQKRLQEFASQSTSEKQFAPYFCGNIDKSIIVNGKRTTFLLFCQKIKGKKIAINELTLFRNDGSNCIENLNLKYKKGSTGFYN